MSGDDPIGLCLAGRISPEVALARLALAGVSPEQIALRLERFRSEPGRPLPCPPPQAGEGRVGARPGWDSNPAVSAHIVCALARLLAERRGGLDRLAGMLARSDLDHAAVGEAPEAALARTRAAFDRAVACSPEASVAAYSLGDPAILAAATAELVAWLEAEGSLGPERDVLDLGCGIGRVAAALAPLCRSVFGLDLSPAMIAEARRQHVRPNLRFAATDGRDLSGLPDASRDLVLAVDSFPYLMQAGMAIAERHVADAARVLRPGGTLAIFNLSYRADPAADREDAARWADVYGFRVVRNGATPFALWDGRVFVLNRAKGR